MNSTPENTFWSLVAEIGWGTKTTDYKSVSNALRKRLGKDGCEAFQNRYHEVLSTLFEAAVSAGHDYANDSWSDVTAHVIGLGRAKYERCLADPDLLVARMNAGEYKESFSYCIPHPVDFKQSQPKEGKVSLLNELQALSTKPEMPQSFMDAIRDMLRAQARGFQKEALFIDQALLRMAEEHWQNRPDLETVKSAVAGWLMTEGLGIETSRFADRCATDPCANAFVVSWTL